jgi:hypothetical protein
MLGLAKQRENARKQAKFQQALSLFNDNKLGIREIQRITGLPYGTLYRKLKNPFKIEQPRGYPAYLSTSEIESVADKLKSAEHKQNGVTMPVLKTMVVDLLAGKNREPPSGTISQAYAKGLRKTLKDDFDVTFAAANRTSSARVASLTVEHIGPFFDQMRIFHAAAPELVEQPGRLVVLDESPLWSQTEKVIIFFSFLVL